MKNVILLGDSIRQGYDEFVAEGLSDVAQVYYPEENCRFSAFLFRSLDRWVQESGFGKEVDVIHWNAGHWDTLIQYQEERLTSPEVYREYIVRIHRRIRKLYPTAIEIFATATPVLEEQYAADFKRLNSDVELYNKIAVEVLEKDCVLINDLYGVANGWSEEYYTDPTHPNVNGSILLGQHTAKMIRNVICTAKTQLLN